MICILKTRHFCGTCHANSLRNHITHKMRLFTDSLVSMIYLPQFKAFLFSQFFLESYKKNCLKRLQKRI